METARAPPAWAGGRVYVLGVRANCAAWTLSGQNAMANKYLGDSGAANSVGHGGVPLIVDDMVIIMPAKA